jgi:hypothetical protein
MLASVLLGLLLAAQPAGCSEVDGWNGGRAGSPASTECKEESYQQAHRLGLALHELKTERAAIETRIDSLPQEKRGAQRRRQRQIDNDVEAIRGVATVNGWPLDVTHKLEKS